MADVKTEDSAGESVHEMAPGQQPVRSTGGQPAYFSCWDIHAYYGESYIVQGVSFDIREGEIVALLGRNGAGKNSTLRAIARVDDPALRGGEIWLDHQALHSMRAHEAAQNGIGLVPEDRRIIAGLTVEENLKLAQIAPPTGWSIERVYDLFPRLGERRKQDGTTLSGGEQQMLSIGRTLARDVKLLLLDEPYEGLAPVIVQEIERTLEQIKALGMTTVLIVPKNFEPTFSEIWERDPDDADDVDYVTDDLAGFLRAINRHNA